MTIVRTPAVVNAAFLATTAASDACIEGTKARIAVYMSLESAEERGGVMRAKVFVALIAKVEI